MKRTLLISTLAVFAAATAVERADAAVITLFEAKSNIDGAVTDASGLLDGSGLGTVTFTVTEAGPHFVSLFADHEIDETLNTFFNEFGGHSGTPAPGQSWEIDEPGWVFGDIYDNFSASALDNSNAIPFGPGEDVSMALGWDFILAAGETATISFTLSGTAPASGFYLTQTDPDSDKSIYFSSAMSVREGTAVPDHGGTLALLGLSLAALRIFSKRKPRETHTASMAA